MTWKYTDKTKKRSEGIYLYSSFLNCYNKEKYKGDIMETLQRELEEIEERRLAIMYELYIIEKYELE